LNKEVIRVNLPIHINPWLISREELWRVLPRHHFNKLVCILSKLFGNGLVLKLHIHAIILVDVPLGGDRADVDLGTIEGLLLLPLSRG
tara:strand:+ start:256 stop:519 length:264 start_codon:yes stop_codon:yes gene_type:complete